MNFSKGNAQSLPIDARQRPLFWGLLASLLFHALLLSLQFGVPGLALPGLDLPWKARSAQLPALQVKLAPAPNLPAASVTSSASSTAAEALSESVATSSATPPTTNIADGAKNSAPSPEIIASTPAPPVMPEIKQPSLRLLDPRPALPPVKSAPAERPTPEKIAKPRIAPKPATKRREKPSTPVITHELATEDGFLMPDVKEIPPIVEIAEIALNEGKDADAADSNEEVKVEAEVETTETPAESEVKAVDETPDTTTDASAEPSPRLRRQQAALDKKLLPLAQIEEKADAKQLSQLAAKEIAKNTPSFSNEVAQIEKQLRASEQAKLAAEKLKKAEEAKRAQQLAEEELAKQAAQKQALAEAKKAEQAEQAKQLALAKALAERSQENALAQTEQVIAKQAISLETEKIIQAAKLQRQADAEKRAAEKAELAKLAEMAEAAELAKATQQKEAQIAAQKLAEENARAAALQSAKLAQAKVDAEVAAAAAAAKTSNAGQAAAKPSATANNTPNSTTTTSTTNANNQAGQTGNIPALNRNLPGSSLLDTAKAQLKHLDLSRNDYTRQVQPQAEPQARRSIFGSSQQDVPVRMYVENWQQKIERNGRLNYSQIASERTREFPLVNVIIASDGRVLEILIMRSSGRADIDEAVRRIVRINAPYAAFPKNIAAKYDQIEIRRVWSFDEGIKLLEEIR